MQTIHLQQDISDEQYQMAVRVLEAINIAVKKPKPSRKNPARSDDAKMTEQDFYNMIEERLEQPTYPLTGEKRKEWFDV